MTTKEFVRAFNQAAAALTEATDKAKKTKRMTVSERQAERWLSGNLTRLPYPSACRVLEHMFPNETAESLFGAPHPPTPARQPEPAPTKTPSIAVSQYHLATHSTAHHPPLWTPHSRNDIEEATAMAAAESARFSQLAEQTNVGPHTLEQFHADLRRIVTVYPNRPVLPLFVEVRELRNRAFSLLEGRQLPNQTRELHLITATLCGILANASFDLGNFAAAETQARTAFLSAELAGHNGIRAWIRGTQALIAYWDDRPRAAAELAADGWRYEPENGTARVRLACIEARARARLRETHETDNALRRAEQAREAITTPDDFAGMMAFPQAKQQFYAGAARLWLGESSANLTTAEQLTTEAVQLYESAAPEDRRLGELSLARLDLAIARLAHRDLDGTADQVELVLEAGGKRRTESVARRLSQLSVALERPHLQTSALATTLRERILCSPVRTQTALPEGQAR